MGRSSEIIASRRLYGKDDGLAWADFPVQAWASTWDVSTYEAHAGPGSWNPALVDPRLG